MTVAPSADPQPKPRKKRAERTTAQKARDAAFCFDLRCRGYVYSEIIERLRLVTAPEGYEIEESQVMRDVRGMEEKLAAQAELSSKMRRMIMQHRIDRRRVQLEAIIEMGTGEIEETTTRRRDILADASKKTDKDGKPIKEKVPVAGSIEATVKKRRQLPPASYFSELTALDRLEMDLHGIAVPVEKAPKFNPDDDMIEGEVIDVEPLKPLDYRGIDELMITQLGGQVVFLDPSADLPS